MTIISIVIRNLYNYPTRCLLSGLVPIWGAVSEWERDMYARGIRQDKRRFKVRTRSGVDPEFERGGERDQDPYLSPCLSDIR